VTDPRYDPRFQRGWDGAPPPAPAPVVVPPPQPDTTRSSPPSLPAPTPDPAPAVEETVPPADADPAMEAEDDPPARNPFRIALVALGIALVVIAAGLFWQMTQDQSGAVQSPDQVALQQLAYTFAPTLLLVGIIALIAAIALGVLRRR
jgi:hypothetical protein